MKWPENVRCQTVIINTADTAMYKRTFTIMIIWYTDWCDCIYIHTVYQRARDYYLSQR